MVSYGLTMIFWISPLVRLTKNMIWVVYVWRPGIDCFVLSIAPFSTLMCSCSARQSVVGVVKRCWRSFVLTLFCFFFLFFFIHFYTHGLYIIDIASSYYIHFISWDVICEPFTNILATFGGPLLSIRRIVAWPQLKFISLGLTHCLAHRYNDDNEHSQKHQDTANSHSYHRAIAHVNVRIFGSPNFTLYWCATVSSPTLQSLRSLLVLFVIRACWIAIRIYTQL